MPGLVSIVTPFTVWAPSPTTNSPTCRPPCGFHMVLHKWEHSPGIRALTKSLGLIMHDSEVWLKIVVLRLGLSDGEEQKCQRKKGWCLPS